MLLTKKIAALTGDVRAVFEVLRGAINIAINSSMADAPSANINPLELSTPPVTPSHILSALKAYGPSSNPGVPAGTSVSDKTCDSETVVKVRELGLQARLVLLSMVLARQRLDAGLSLGGISPSHPSTPRTPSKRSQNTSDSQGLAMDVGHLHGYYKAVLGRSDNGVLNAVSRSEFGDLLGLLETVGFLGLSGAVSPPTTPSKSGKRGLTRSVSFGGVARKMGVTSIQEVKFVEGLRMDEVRRGLGIQDDVRPGTDDLMQEEVRVIYEKERVRIARGKHATVTASEIFQDAIAP